MSRPALGLKTLMYEAMGILGAWQLPCQSFKIFASEFAGAASVVNAPAEATVPICSDSLVHPMSANPLRTFLAAAGHNYHI